MENSKELLTKASEYIKKEEFSNARQILNMIVEKKPSSEVYWALLLCDMQVTDENELISLGLSISDNENYKKAFLLADDKQTSEYIKIHDAIYERAFEKAGICLKDGNFFAAEKWLNRLEPVKKQYLPSVLFMKAAILTRDFNDLNFSDINKWNELQKNICKSEDAELKNKFHSAKSKLYDNILEKLKKANAEERNDIFKTATTLDGDDYRSYVVMLENVTANFSKIDPPEEYSTYFCDATQRINDEKLRDNLKTQLRAYESFIAKEAQDRKNKTLYDEAVQLEKKCKYVEAAHKFEQLGDFSNAREQAVRCRNYEEAAKKRIKKAAIKKEFISLIVFALAHFVLLYVSADNTAFLSSGFVTPICTVIFAIGLHIFLSARQNFLGAIIFLLINCGTSFYTIQNTGGSHMTLTNALICTLFMYAIIFVLVLLIHGILVSSDHPVVGYISVLVLSIVSIFVSGNASNYLSGVSKFADGDYPAAYYYLSEAGDFLDSAEKHKKAESLYKDKIAAGSVGIFADIVKSSVGDTVEFGKYPYQKASEYEPIEWIVLEKDENGVLLITKNIINTTKMEDRMGASGTWESSSLRKYLNETARNDNFFTIEEQMLMAQTENYTSDSESGGKDGTTVLDYLFILSYEEVLEYFPTEEARKAVKTPFAARNDSIFTLQYWYTRSPGFRNDFCKYVNGDGVVEEDYRSDENGLRPCIRLEW